MWIINADHIDIAKRLLVRYLTSEPIDAQAFYHKMSQIKEICEHDGVHLKTYPGYAADIQEWIQKNITKMEDNKVIESGLQ